MARISTTSDYQRADLLADCTGIILAGGESQRFGSCKANAIWDGQTLIRHVAERLRGVCARIIAVTRCELDGSGWPVDEIVFDDLLLHAGPLRGLVAGLAACRTHYSAVASCDTPLINPDLYRFLYALMTDDDVGVVPLWNGQAQPLSGIYEATQSEPLLRSALRGGEHSLTRALWSVGCRAVPQRMIHSIDPSGLCFVSINTPDDFLKLYRTTKLSSP